jgi:hypothetical protein
VAVELFRQPANEVWISDIGGAESTARHAAEMGTRVRKGDAATRAGCGDCGRDRS